MAFGGKRVGQVVTGLGGNGVGRVLVAVAAALLFRLFSGPGPALLPDSEPEGHDENDEFDGDGGAGEKLVPGNFFPMTIRWRNITCSLSDKASKSVTSFSFLKLLFKEPFPCLENVAEKSKHIERLDTSTR